MVNVGMAAQEVMTGRTLHRSKFPYTFDMKEYLNSLGKLRLEQADHYIVAHERSSWGRMIRSARQVMSLSSG